MSLSIKEASRSGDVLSLRLYANGLPKDKIYTIVQWPVTQATPSDLMSGVTFDANWTRRMRRKTGDLQRRRPQ